MAVTEERTGAFDIRRIKNKSNDNYRTIAFESKDKDAKQIGSTFDEDIADKLAAYPEGATITLELDKSGRFWDIVGARLADDGDQSGAKSDRAAPSGGRPAAAFNDRDMTYFIGSSSRVIAALLTSSREYRDKIEEAQDPVEALHNDVSFGARLMFNEANKG